MSAYYAKCYSTLRCLVCYIIKLLLHAPFHECMVLHMHIPYHWFKTQTCTSHTITCVAMHKRRKIYVITWLYTSPHLNWLCWQRTFPWTCIQDTDMHIIIIYSRMKSQQICTYRVLIQWQVALKCQFQRWLHSPCHSLSMTPCVPVVCVYNFFHTHKWFWILNWEGKGLQPFQFGHIYATAPHFLWPAPSILPERQIIQCKGY